MFAKPMDSLSRKTQIGQRQSSRLRRQRSKEWQKEYSSSDNEDDHIGQHKAAPMHAAQNGQGLSSFGHVTGGRTYDDPVKHQYEEPRIVIDTSGRKNNFGECVADDNKPTVLWHRYSDRLSKHLNDNIDLLLK